MTVDKDGELEMTFVRKRFAIALGAAAALIWCYAAHADDPFYKDKRLSVLINFAAGGSTDIEGRLFARHIAKHMRRTPTSSSRTWTAPAASTAPVISARSRPRTARRSAIWGHPLGQYASDPERFRVDFKSYEFVSYQPGTTVYYTRTDVAPG